MQTPQPLAYERAQRLMHLHRFVLCCSLPVVIRGRGRPAWDAIYPALKTALNKLDAQAQVQGAGCMQPWPWVPRHMQLVEQWHWQWCMGP